ncbi:MAG: hypothetical protein LBI10_02240 [Deltaproteobacteria bacterium]|nr:hypothetical protein [Deltaproteobacteria bacterium]
MSSTEETNGGRQKQLLGPFHLGNWEQFFRDCLDHVHKFPYNDDSLAFLRKALRSIDEFKENFRLGTSNSERFMSITDIEELLLKLNKETMENNFDILSKEINNISEKHLVDLKKKNSLS